jgi:hypothetical protein
VQRLLAQPLQLLIYLVAVMPQQLDTVLALLCIEVAVTEDRPRRLDACWTLS